MEIHDPNKFHNTNIATVVEALWDGWFIFLKHIAGVRKALESIIKSTIAKAPMESERGERKRFQAQHSEN